MKIYLISVVVLSLLTNVRAGDQDTPEGESASSPGAATTNRTDSDADRQQGVWKPIAAIIGGAYLPPPALKATTLSIKGMNYDVTVEGEDHSDKGTFTLDTTAVAHDWWTPEGFLRFLSGDFHVRENEASTSFIQC